MRLYKQTIKDFVVFAQKKQQQTILFKLINSLLFWELVAVPGCRTGR